MRRTDGLVEIRIHGRGGQGNVVAAYLLASAAVRTGNYVQAFPAFGAERRGAPVTAFVRCRTTPILRRSQVEHPDLVVVQDPTLLSDPGTLDGLQADGGIVINSGRRDSLTADLPSSCRVVFVPATRIAEETIGRAIPNVPLLAALISLTAIVPMNSLFGAFEERFDRETATRNRLAAEAATSIVAGGAWRDLIAIGEAHADGN